MADDFKIWPYVPFAGEGGLDTGVETRAGVSESSSSTEIRGIVAQVVRVCLEQRTGNGVLDGCG